SDCSIALCRPPFTSTLLPYTTLFRSDQPFEQFSFDRFEQVDLEQPANAADRVDVDRDGPGAALCVVERVHGIVSSRYGGYGTVIDRKSTRLNSSHVKIWYAVFCLKKK